MITREENLRGKPMTSGAYAPYVRSTAFLTKSDPVKRIVYLGHTCLVRFSSHALTSPQSVKSGLRHWALIARTHGPSHQEKQY
jgi:hypothetical protein